MLRRAVTTLVVVLHFSFAESSIICSTTGLICHHDRECCSSLCYEGFCAWITPGVKGIDDVKNIQDGVKTWDPSIKQVAGIKKLTSDRRVFIPGAEANDEKVFAGERGYHDTEEEYSSITYCSDETEYSSSSSGTNEFKDVGPKENERDFSESSDLLAEKEFSSEFEVVPSGNRPNTKQDVPRPDSSHDPNPNIRHEPRRDNSQEYKYVGPEDYERDFSENSDLVAEKEFSSEFEFDSSRKPPDTKWDVPRPDSSHDPSPNIRHEPKRDNSQEKMSKSSYEPSPDSSYEPISDRWQDLKPDRDVTRPISFESSIEKQCAKDSEVCRQDSECCSRLCQDYSCVSIERRRRGDPRDGDVSNPTKLHNSFCLEDYSTCNQDGDCCSLECFAGTSNGGLCLPMNTPIQYHPSDKGPGRSFNHEDSLLFDKANKTFQPSLGKLNDISAHPFDRGYSEREVSRPVNSPLENAYFEYYDYPRKEDLQSPYQTIGYSPYIYPNGIKTIPQPTFYRPFVGSRTFPTYPFGRDDYWENAIESTLDTPVESFQDHGKGGYYGDNERKQVPQRPIIWQPYAAKGQVHPFITNHLEKDYGFRDMPNEHESELSALADSYYAGSPKRVHPVDSNLYTLQEHHYKSFSESLSTDEEDFLTEEENLRDYGQEGYFEFYKRKHQPQKTMIRPTYGPVHPFITKNLETGYGIRDIQDDFASELSAPADVPHAISPKRTLSVESILETTNGLHYNLDGGSLETEEETSAGDSLSRDDLKPDESNIGFLSGHEADLSVLPHMSYTSSPKAKLPVESTLDTSNDLHYYPHSKSSEIEGGASMNVLVDRDNLEKDQYEYELSNLEDIAHTSSPKRTLSVESTLTKSNDLNYNPDGKILESEEIYSGSGSLSRNYLKSDESFIEPMKEHKSDLSVKPHIFDTSFPKITSALESTLATFNGLHYNPGGESLETEDGTSRGDSLSIDYLKPKENFIDLNRNESDQTAATNLAYNSSPKRKLSVESTLAASYELRYSEDSKFSEAEDLKSTIVSLGRNNLETDYGIRDLNEYEYEHSALTDIPYASSPKRALSVESTPSISNEVNYNPNSDSLEPEDERSKVHTIVKDELKSGEVVPGILNEHDSEHSFIQNLPFTSFPNINKLDESIQDMLIQKSYSSLGKSLETEEGTSQARSNLETGGIFRYKSSAHESGTFSIESPSDEILHNLFGEYGTEERTDLNDSSSKDHLKADGDFKAQSNELESELSVSYDLITPSLPKRTLSIESALNRSEDPLNIPFERYLETEEQWKDNSVEYLNDYNEGGYERGVMPQHDVVWLSHGGKPPSYPVERGYSEMTNVPSSQTPSGTFYSETNELISGSVEGHLRDNKISPKYVHETNGWLQTPLVVHGIKSITHPLGAYDANNRLNEEDLRTKFNSNEQTYPYDWNDYRFEENREYKENILDSFESVISGDTNINYPTFYPRTFSSGLYPQTYDERLVNRLPAPRDYPKGVYPYYGRIGLAPNIKGYSGMQMKSNPAIPLLYNPEEWIFKKEKMQRNDNRRSRLCKTRQHRKKCKRRKDHRNCIQGLHRSKHWYQDQASPGRIRGSVPLKTEKATENLITKQSSQEFPKKRGRLGFGDLIRLGAKRVVG